MHKKFEINETNIKGGCQSGRKVVPHDSKSDLPLVGELVYKNVDLSSLIPLHNLTMYYNNAPFLVLTYMYLPIIFKAHQLRS